MKNKILLFPALALVAFSSAVIAAPSETVFGSIRGDIVSTFQVVAEVPSAPTSTAAPAPVSGAPFPDRYPYVSQSQIDNYFNSTGGRLGKTDLEAAGEVHDFLMGADLLYKLDMEAFWKEKEAKATASSSVLQGYLGQGGAVGLGIGFGVGTECPPTVPPANTCFDNCMAGKVYEVCEPPPPALGEKEVNMSQAEKTAFCRNACPTSSTGSSTSTSTPVTQGGGAVCGESGSTGGPTTQGDGTTSTGTTGTTTSTGGPMTTSGDSGTPGSVAATTRSAARIPLSATIQVDTNRAFGRNVPLSEITPEFIRNNKQHELVTFDVTITPFDADDTEFPNPIVQIEKDRRSVSESGILGSTSVITNPELNDPSKSFNTVNTAYDQPKPFLPSATRVHGQPYRFTLVVEAASFAPGVLYFEVGRGGSPEDDPVIVSLEIGPQPVEPQAGTGSTSTITKADIDSVIGTYFPSTTSSAPKGPCDDPLWQEFSLSFGETLGEMADAATATGKTDSLDAMTTMMRDFLARKGIASENFDEYLEKYRVCISEQAYKITTAGFEEGGTSQPGGPVITASQPSNSVNKPPKIELKLIDRKRSTEFGFESFFVYEIEIVVTDEDDSEGFVDAYRNNAYIVHDFVSFPFKIDRGLPLSSNENEHEILRVIASDKQGENRTEKVWDLTRTILDEMWDEKWGLKGEVRESILDDLEDYTSGGGLTTTDGTSSSGSSEPVAKPGAAPVIGDFRYESIAFSSATRSEYNVSLNVTDADSANGRVELIQAGSGNVGWVSSLWGKSFSTAFPLNNWPFMVAFVSGEPDPVVWIRATDAEGNVTTKMFTFRKSMMTSGSTISGQVIAPEPTAPIESVLPDIDKSTYAENKVKVEAFSEKVKTAEKIYPAPQIAKLATDFSAQGYPATQLMQRAMLAEVYLRLAVLLNYNAYYNLSLDVLRKPSDVPSNAVFQRAILLAVANGLFTLSPEGNFYPYGSVNRAMYVTTFVRFLQLRQLSVPSKLPFEYVLPQLWYAQYFWTLYMTTGGLFPALDVSPEQEMTTEDAFVSILQTLEENLVISSRDQEDSQDVVAVADSTQALN